jgi:hypothetical protein
MGTCTAKTLLEIAVIYCGLQCYWKVITKAHLGRNIAGKFISSYGRFCSNLPHQYSRYREQHGAYGGYRATQNYEINSLI